MFRGEEAVLPDDRAVLLIEYLLKNPPDEPIHATVWENYVDGNPVVDGIERLSGGIGGGGIGGVVQEAAGKKLMGGTGVLLKNKLAELRADIDDMTLPESEQRKRRRSWTKSCTQEGMGARLSVLPGGRQTEFVSR